MSALCVQSGHRTIQPLEAADPSHPNSGGNIVTAMLELPVLAQIASCGEQHKLSNEALQQPNR
eukprot:3040496-Amphidinium_carterae.2